MESTTRSGRKRPNPSAAVTDLTKVKKRKQTSKQNSVHIVASAVMSPPSPVPHIATTKSLESVSDVYSAVLTPSSKKAKRLKLSKASVTIVDKEASAPQTAVVVSKRSSAHSVASSRANSHESLSDKSNAEVRVGTSVSSAGVKMSAPQKKKGASKGPLRTSADTVSMETIPSSSAIPHTSKPAAKTKIKRRPFYLKPTNGSWSKQMGYLLTYRCVSQALVQSIDPRHNQLNDLSWNNLAGGFLSPKDLKLLWFLINKEFPDKPLVKIRDELKPYATLNVEEFMRADIMDKYKDDIPKAPPTPYMLFVITKSSSLKAKHPELSQTAIAKKLGMKWHLMGVEKQDKFKEQYVQLKKVYVTKMTHFYSIHPDAKAPKRIQKQGSKDKDDNLTVEERRIKELKALMPKLPPSSYVLFCQAKREKLHRKYPEMNPRDVNSKLSKRWKSIGDKGQAKYKELNREAMKLHRERVEAFYETYPDAKEMLTRAKKGKSNLLPVSTQTSDSVTSLARVVPLLDQDDTDFSDESDTDEAGDCVPGEAVKSDEDTDNDDDDEIDVDVDDQDDKLSNRSALPLRVQSSESMVSSDDSSVDDSD